MAEQSSGLGEAVDVGTSAASHLHAMKTAAHLSKTVAGAAAGPFTAAISAAIANRHTLLKAGARYPGAFTASRPFHPDAAGADLRISDRKHRGFKQQCPDQ